MKPFRRPRIDRAILFERVFWSLVAVFGSFVGAWIAAIVVMSCAPAAEKLYRDDLERCVRESKTIEASHACRKDVDRTWGVDSGNP